MTRCARCGNEAQGFATIGLLRYCHGDQEQPTCYMQQNWGNMRDRLDDGSPLTLTLDEVAQEFGIDLTEQPNISRGKGRDAHEDHHTTTVAAAAAAERRRAWAEQDYPIDRPDPSEW